MAVFFFFFLHIAESFELFLAVGLAEQQSDLCSDELGFETRSLSADTDLKYYTAHATIEK